MSSENNYLNELVLRYIDFLKTHLFHKKFFINLGYLKAAPFHKTLLREIFNDYINDYIQDNYDQTFPDKVSLNQEKYGDDFPNVYKIFSGESGINVDEYAEIIHSDPTRYNENLKKQSDLLKTKYDISNLVKEKMHIEEKPFINRKKLKSKVMEVLKFSDEEIRFYAPNLDSIIENYASFIEQKIKETETDEETETD